VIGADCNSRICNPADKKTFPLFGDGAGAVLLSAGSSEQGLLSYTMGADGSGGNLLCIPGGGSRIPTSNQSIADNQQFLYMDGRPVFKWAIQRDAGMTVGDVDYFVLHQANLRIIDAVAEKLQIPSDKILNNLQRYGNTSAGSIPLVLDEAVCEGRIRTGSKVVLCGFGAGLAWGTGLFAW
jgi:3-oxoacyl-[acyl-carrier-protein] synthase-3